MDVLPAGNNMLHMRADDRSAAVSPNTDESPTPPRLHGPPQNPSAALAPVAISHIEGERCFILGGWDLILATARRTPAKQLS